MKNLTRGITLHKKIGESLEIFCSLKEKIRFWTFLKIFSKLFSTILAYAWFVDALYMWIFLIVSFQTKQPVMRPKKRNDYHLGSQAADNSTFEWRKNRFREPKKKCCLLTSGSAVKIFWLFGTDLIEPFQPDFLHYINKKGIRIFLFLIFSKKKMF